MKRLVRALAPGLALLLSLAAPAARAAEARPFGGPYFSAEVRVPEDDAGWSTLARAHPNRVKRVEPPTPESLRAPAATRVEVRPGIEYVRVRDLAHDLAVIEGALESAALIVDLRYVRGELAEALAFGGLLARQRLALDPLQHSDGRVEAIEPRQLRARHQATLVLVNRATAGPIEAVLDALQAAGDVLLVGTQTAGDTGLFVTVPSAPEWSVILDDFRRAQGPSLLDVGVTPQLFVETTRDGDDAAYLALDAGSPIADLLDAPVQKSRFDEARLLQQFDQTNGRANNAARPAEPADNSPRENDPADNDPPRVAATAPFDRTLQRAVATLVTAEALGRIAPLTPAAAASAR